MTLHAALGGIGLAANDGVGNAAMCAHHGPSNLGEVGVERSACASLDSAMALEIDKRNATSSSLWLALATQ